MFTVSWNVFKEIPNVEYCPCLMETSEEKLIQFIYFLTRQTLPWRRSKNLCIIRFSKLFIGSIWPRYKGREFFGYLGDHYPPTKVHGVVFEYDLLHE